MSLRCNALRYSHWWLDRCFLYVGRMVEAKGVPQILSAWLKLAAQLEDTCPPLWLVGGYPSEIESMRKTADPLQLSKHEAAGRVRWWGYLDWTGISALMLKAHVLVTHSLYEPGGRVVLEALAQGIPVIATPNGFAADLITDWKTGFLVSYGDVNSLYQRMQHFAFQPLLRHAMGQAARRSAQQALEEWNFIGQHLRIYDLATSSEGRVLEEALPRPCSLRDTPVPRGFEGVYPFEAEKIGFERVAAFLARNQSIVDTELSLFEDNGRSRLWIGKCSGASTVIKHAFSTYRVRPMWDRGFTGSAVETQTSRVQAELLGGKCYGVAPIVAVDLDAGLIMREWLEPVAARSIALKHYAGVISAFHRSTPSLMGIDEAKNVLDRNWNKMNEDEVVDEVRRLESTFQVQNRPWHAWRPMSIRLSWRWLQLGLRRYWLSAPAALADDLSNVANQQSSLADQETQIPFGICHGDCESVHFRLRNRDELVLIDCERLHPGYFGHDWASLIWSILPDNSEDLLWLTFQEACDAIQPNLCPAWLCFSWLLWITAMEICKANALRNANELTKETRRWQVLRHIASQVHFIR